MNTSERHLSSIRVLAGRVRKYAAAYLRFTVEFGFICSVAAILLLSCIALATLLVGGVASLYSFVANWRECILAVIMFGVGCSTIVAAFWVMLSPSTFEREVCDLGFVKEGYLVTFFRSVGRGARVVVTFPFRLFFDRVPWWKLVAAVFPQECVTSRYPRIPN